MVFNRETLETHELIARFFRAFRMFHGRSITSTLSSCAEKMRNGSGVEEKLVEFTNGCMLREDLHIEISRLAKLNCWRSWASHQSEPERKRGTAIFRACAR